MTTQHTPGPWRAETNRSPLTITRELDHLPAAQGGHRQFRDIAEVYVDDKGDGAPEDYANARLIASAPEMLELCQTVLFRLDVEHAERIAKGETAPHFICAALRDDLRAVIAKATGAPSHVSPFTPHPSAQ